MSSSPPLQLESDEGGELGVDEMDNFLIGNCVLFVFCVHISSGTFPFVRLTGTLDWSIDRVENLSDNEGDGDFLRLIGKLVGLGLLIGE